MHLDTEELLQAPLTFTVTSTYSKHLRVATAQFLATKVQHFKESYWQILYGKSRSWSSARPVPPRLSRHPMGIAYPINGHVLAWLAAAGTARHNSRCERVRFQRRMCATSFPGSGLVHLALPCNNV
ncbi:hypothetical protein DBV15_02987 [Temnothorax longispinosus]|uniref:Uncharacterized protein n=1 Tax=Temnothorax longispinosus TaxID=300112 RepID=A0A4S2KCM2_9HYME|nr:hypothetical protein DBV15_02987 [Temnothorax longispinosus]